MENNRFHGIKGYYTIKTFLITSDDTEKLTLQLDDCLIIIEPEDLIDIKFNSVIDDNGFIHYSVLIIFKEYTKYTDEDLLENYQIDLDSFKRELKERGKNI